MTPVQAREAKWQAAWKDQKAFEPTLEPGKPKFFCTFPYPYVNGRPHVGHLFTAMRVEAAARYNRMLGKEVLFPQAWHCTGQPIVAAAQLVKQGDEKQIQILRDNGIADEDIPKFTEPEHWVSYFPEKYREDWERLGLSIDWRREFITTSLNPRYDVFIRWQLSVLKDKGYVKKGKHAVVWDPVGNTPVGDHDRREGEGETPQEYTLIAFALEGAKEKLAIATLRPETLPGATNLWVHPAITYHRVTVRAPSVPDGETWIVSAPCMKKLPDQEYEVTDEGTILGSELIGKTVTTPDGERSIPVLPATFPTADKGTGIVLSVPSDAPDDYIALLDLQRDAKVAEKYKLDAAMLKAIEPIPIIDAGELGHLAAVKAVQDFKIANQKERDKLDLAKKLVYKKGYYEGKLLVGPYAGEAVEIAKEKIKRDLLATGQAHKFYELTGKVVTRTLVDCTVKVVSNQWFIDYGDPAWKEQAHKALDRMQLFPEKARAQFNHVIDWLREWACARETGLGTRLPWDEHWLIESLSDSTLYNAYYTFAHLLADYPEKRVTPALFDYVILGKGTPPATETAAWEAMRAEFMYWYPVDFRNSGKDLIQNHLSFMLFTHVAFFPDNPEADQNPSTFWPQSYGVNGFVTVNGKKMSKSLGNVIPVRALLEEFGADASRLTILNGGEGMDDPNWDSELAKTTVQRTEQFIELCAAHAHDDARTRHESLPVDAWFASVVHRTIKDATAAMNELTYRAAIQAGWFELTNVIKRYRKLCADNPHTPLLRFALETQCKLLQPFMPHAAQEAWSALGNTRLLYAEPWPEAKEGLIDEALEATQDLIEQLASDIRSVQTLLKKETLHAVTIIVAPAWQYGFFAELKAALKDTRDIRELLPRFTASHKEHAAAVQKLLPLLVRDPSKLPRIETTQERELGAVTAATEYLAKQFGARITVESAEMSSAPKAASAQPGRPAILLE
jgi:leucyl-tRNA synthetase